MALENHCFAPDLTDAKLAEYRTLVDGCRDRELKDALQQCLRCVDVWWGLPESKRTDGKSFNLLRPAGKIVAVNVVPLEDGHVQSLDAVTPWMRELLAMEEHLVDKLPDGTKEVPTTIATPKGTSTITKSEVVDEAAFKFKTAAKHLIWLCKEITLDREPLTMDKLPS